jgi:hypothetical protein
MTADTVFEAIAKRLDSRAAEIGLFLDSGRDFEPWCVWEAFAACREAGWPAWPMASYAKVGMLGSRDSADLLVGLDGGGHVIGELGLIHAWSTNRWIASIDEDTRLLSRSLSTGVDPLQLVLAVAPEPIEQNDVWKSWLEMTAIWSRPTELDHELPMRGGKHAVLRGWKLKR